MPNVAFEMQEQQRPDWCWAAVAVSVDRHFSRASTWRQCRLAKLELQATRCCRNPVSDCDQSWHLERALQRVGRLAGPPVAAGLTFAGIQTEIDAGRPICVRTEWSDRTAHFVVIAGYNVTRGGVEYVEVEDSLDGPIELPYNTFVNRYRGNGRWSHTYPV